ISGKEAVDQTSKMARSTGTLLSDVWRFRNLIIVVLTPLLLLPLPLLVDGELRQRLFRKTRAKWGERNCPSFETAEVESNHRPLDRQAGVKYPKTIIRVNNRDTIHRHFVQLRSRCHNRTSEPVLSHKLHALHRHSFFRHTHYSSYYAWVGFTIVHNGAPLTCSAAVDVLDELQSTRFG
ncbi:hypothetical protein LSAT2_032019, partial [Lamellibrachia satsuma]